MPDDLPADGGDQDAHQGTDEIEKTERIINAAICQRFIFNLSCYDLHFFPVKSFTAADTLSAAMTDNPPARLQGAQIKAISFIPAPNIIGNSISTNARRDIKITSITISTDLFLAKRMTPKSNIPIIVTTTKIISNIVQISLFNLSGIFPETILNILLHRLSVLAATFRLPDR